ncbi:MAG: S41 family peptidase, partial [Bacteroidota bacterium]
FRVKGLRKQSPKGKGFTGELYILTSGYTYSAAAELSAYCQAYRPNTTFIGAETGGAVQGNTSGLFAFVRLKHSRFGAYIPLIRYNMNVDTPAEGRGVVPDYPMENSLSSRKEGKDDLLEFVYSQVKENE